MRLLGEDVAVLRRRGYVTDRPAPVVRTQGGELLVALEWSSEHAELAVIRKGDGSFAGTKCRWQRRRG